MRAVLGLRCFDVVLMVETSFVLFLCFYCRLLWLSLSTFSLLLAPSFLLHLCPYCFLRLVRDVSASYTAKLMFVSQIDQIISNIACRFIDTDTVKSML